MKRRFSVQREKLFQSPPRRAAYYTLVQAAYVCLAGSFEMPMVCRLAGRIDFVAGVYAFFYGFLFLGFALGMVILRGGRASALYRAAIVLWISLAISVTAFFPYIRGMVPLVAYFIIRGLADGFYWSARHRSFLWSVRDSGRDRFALRLQAAVVSLTVVLPIVGGFAITYLGRNKASLAASEGLQAALLPEGYRSVFFVALCAMILALLFSPDFKIGASTLRLKAALGILRLHDGRLWCANICFGGFAGAMLAVAAGIQTFGLLRTEFKIGALNATVALLSSVVFVLLGRFFSGRPGMRLKGAFAGSLADFFSRCIYALSPTTSGLALKSLLDALFVPLKNLLGENVVFSLIERLGKGKDGPGEISTAELYLFREFFLESARIAGCVSSGLIFLAVSHSGVDDAPRFTARLLIALSAPVAIVDFLFIRTFEKANGRKI